VLPNVCLLSRLLKKGSRNLKLPTLTYRRKRGDMIEVFKMTSGIYDTSLPSLYITNKAIASLRFIKRNVKTNSIKTKELAYKTYVRPKV
jgi:hypothetical protein